ncbi:ribonuclease HII [Vulcanisaeta distributa]|uniref:Ribonuclease HII n=1 Tax=Vulcanisaeta distributa (strain DSM 14429 / JCM 11212 / NBRC 100878 / IC-017) TaxID=572478 RepID=E1QTT8_VULDI|nr:ribonuclease HII [Vulcanisaeta distributa]ADN51005.1 ribonuclease HII [Vulcanisaeta distributa DSM 14429]
MQVLVGGIDEAGRGPVIGPMVMAIAVTNDMNRLKAMGIRDSKELSPAGRARLFSILKSTLNYIDYEIVEPRVIDNYVYMNALNILEVEIAIKLINRALNSVSPQVVYIDSPDPRPERYRDMVKRGVVGNVEVVAMNNADKLIPVVSAASIVAKVIRDSIIEELHREYGDFGSGYPSDPRTMAFLRDWVKRHGDLPPIVRRSWSTVRKLLSNSLDRYLS